MTLNKKDTIGTGQHTLLKWIGAAFACAPVLSTLSGMAASPPPPPAPVPLVGVSFPAGMTTDGRQSLERDLKSLGSKLTSLRSSSPRNLAQLDRLADADLFH